MLNSKQRAKLRSMANGLETILQIGKGGISDNTVKQINDALLARELIAAACGCEVVQVLGTRITLYKPNPEEPVIALD